MPRTPTTTKEAMIEGAFQLIREKGHGFLTARNLAVFLGCSTQPIMYQFPNLDTLRELAYQKADAFHSAYILSDMIIAVFLSVLSDGPAGLTVLTFIYPFCI